MKKPVYYILFTINVITAICTLLAAYGGVFNPCQFSAVPAIAAMTFPFWALLTVILAVADYFLSPKLIWLQVFMMFTCFNAMYILCPLGLGAEKPLDKSEQESAFTVLTYNGFGFKSYKDNIPAELTLKTIVEADADLVCIQEAGYTLDKMKSHSDNEDLIEMLDTLTNRYPYIIDDGNGYALYSKFKVDSVVTPVLPGSSGCVKNYRVDVRGNALSLYNIHLESIGLSNNDKELYRQLTKGEAKSDDMPKVKHMILAKLKHAFEIRAKQAEAIRKIMDVDTTGAVLLCGDFNDITYCYAMRVLMGHNLMFDAYTQSGFGPAITYRDNRFFFCIDHILYGRSLRTSKTEVIYEGASDHLPVKSHMFFKSPEKTE